MNSLNITQNSNDLNESEKTQEKLYSNEGSLDDLLTYSDDFSQNQINNKPQSIIINSNINEKKENKKGDIELSNKIQLPVINSFNSEVGMSFLKNQNDNNNINNNNDYHSKSASKTQSKEDLKDNQNLTKSYSDSKPNSFIKSNLFEQFNINNNLKDISEIHISMSNLLSDFEIKDISISRSINENLKKNKSEKKNHNINPVSNNDNCLSIRSENIFNKINKENYKTKEKITNLLNINNNQISEDHSNANSMCNYKNNSNINEISSKNNKEIIQKEEDKQIYNNNKIISQSEINDLSIKLNISIDNYNDQKYQNEKTKYLDEIIMIMKSLKKTI